MADVICRAHAYEGPPPLDIAVGNRAWVAGPNQFGTIIAVGTGSTAAVALDNGRTWTGLASALSRFAP